MKDPSVISCNFDDEYFVCSDSALLSDTEQTVNLSSPLHLSPSPAVTESLQVWARVPVRQKTHQHRADLDDERNY